MSAYDPFRTSGPIPTLQARVVGVRRLSQISYNENIRTTSPLTIRSTLAVDVEMPNSQTETSNHAPRMASINSSKMPRADKVNTSAAIMRNPTQRTVFVAVESAVKRSAHGEMQSQIPSNRLPQSCHSLGGENNMTSSIVGNVRN